MCNGQRQSEYKFWAGNSQLTQLVTAAIRTPQMPLSMAAVIGVKKKKEMPLSIAAAIGSLQSTPLNEIQSDLVGLCCIQMF